MTVATSPPTTYTEAHHAVYGGRIDHAPPIPTVMSGGPALLAPRSIAAHYEVRTQLGHTCWQHDTVEVTGTWVTSTGEPDQRFVISPNATVLLSAGDQPDWVTRFAQAEFPHDRWLGVPGLDFHPAPAPRVGPPIGDPPITVTQVTTTTVLRHTAYDSRVTGADPLPVPSREPGRRARWMRPDRVDVTYRLAYGTGQSTWRVADVSVTGPWVTDTGERDRVQSGTARWAGGTGGTLPDWLDAHVSAHIPRGVTIT